MRDRDDALPFLTFFILFLVASFAVPARGESGCEDDTGNLLAKRNCGFARGIEGWAPAGGDGTAVAHESDDGSPRPGALAAAGAEGSVVVAGPCVEARGATSHRASIRVRATGGVVFSCSLTGRQYTDSECKQGRELLDITAAAARPNPEWQTATATVATSAGFASVRVHLECNGEPGFEVLFDDVVLARE
jgi:hypothetical protein